MAQVGFPTATDIKSNFTTGFAVNAADIRKIQQLRYQIFSDELRATLRTLEPGIDKDSFDEYCHHLFVKDERTGEFVGTTRILTEEKAHLAGGFYSESEFELAKIKALPGKKMEVGRTCIASQYRQNGAGIGTLWSGLTHFMQTQGYDYLMGCASIPIDNDFLQVQQIMAHLRENYFTPQAIRVTPRNPIPEADRNQESLPIKFWPPLLKAYVRLGAKIGGEACWDKDFNVADVFILLKKEEFNPRYYRHFFRK